MTTESLAESAYCRQGQRFLTHVEFLISLHFPTDFDVATYRAPVLVAIAMVERGIDAISAVTLIRSKR